ncbi:MAG: diguanylate cyclase [Schwartzia sp.]|nr:diguanylate cyclase [Schwartzia sp. (in: firmicutes)]
MKELNFYQTLKFKGFAGLFVLMIAIFFVTYSSCKDSLQSLQHDLISERLNSDILFLESTIDNGPWWVNEAGRLYKGDTFLGDGRKETANIKPFTDFEDKTGTFCYVFRVDNTRKLQHIDAGYNTLAYDEGHFLRVAGSTLDPNGNSIVGTYMTKNVSDVLDSKGYYEGEANVAGGMIYCVYSVIRDDSGNVIGATVVGRSTEALNQHINRRASLLVAVLTAIFTVSFIMQGGFINVMAQRLKQASDYVAGISLDTLPEEALKFSGKDEFLYLSNGINNMVENLKTTEKLRQAAETDQLTQIPNRLGFNKISQSLMKSADLETLAVSMIDIDFFKQYNDNYGHVAGDKCIKLVAGVISAACKRYKNCYVARYGGDEFVIIYKNKTKEELCKINAHLKDTMHKAALQHEFSKVNDIVTLSIGTYLNKVSVLSDFGKYIHNADQVLYKVKETRRDDFLVAEEV